MLEDSFPTFRFRPSADKPLVTLLYFTHNGSSPTVDYLLQRPTAGESRNQYALGLVDVHCASVVYGEVLVHPRWSQPSLSAAELRAQGGAAAVVPVVPDTLSVSLYNPDQTVKLRLQRSSFKSDAWEFDMPEQSFQPPSTSQIDQEAAAAAAAAATNNGASSAASAEAIAELTPRVLFRWKRDSRLSRDMTCYMAGRSFGGKKSKEPDITIAMYRAGRSNSSSTGSVVIYEPNMARVDVEDRKGLEVVLLLSAEAIRDLYLLPRANPFNTTGAPDPVDSAGKTQGASPAHASSGRQQQQQQPAYASGALGGLPPPSSPPSSKPGRDAAAAMDAEKRRLQAVSAEERRIQQMLEREDAERRRLRQAAVDAETERLRKQYGLSADTPALPPRPSSAGTSLPASSSSSQQQQQQHGRAYKLGNALGMLLHGRDDKDDKVKKKRSVYF